MSTTAAPGDDIGTRDPLNRFVPVLAMLAIMWVSEIVDIALDHRLDRQGIQPRTWSGLDGVLWAPFLHGGVGHLIANSIPFLLLGCAIAVGTAVRFLAVTAIVGVVGGLGTWLVAPSDTIHIGASGLVFGYITYLMARGLFARRIGYLLGGLLTFVLYGGALWGVLPTRPGVSWQGHLFGAIGGVVAAYVLHTGSRTDDDGRRGGRRGGRSLIDRLSPPGY